VQISNWITLELLSQFAGATAVVLLVVEAIKLIAKSLWRGWTDQYSVLTAVVVSLGVVLLNTYLAAGLSLVSVVLSVLNGLAVFYAATGIFRAAKEKVPQI